MLKVLDHPLITHKLTQMRKKETKPKDFRQCLDEISALMVYEVTRDFSMLPVTIKTFNQTYTTYEVEKDVVVAPILRAGLGMVNGICNLIPTCKVAHIGLYRDELTLQPKVYFEKYPDHLENANVIVVDPMLATGGSAIAAIDMLKKQGATKIRLMSLIGAPEGVAAVEKAHPDLTIYLAALDEKLNENGYIIPGLGDAGDRIFGTN